MSLTLNFELWPRQETAIQSPAREIMYGGSAGGGKSHLMRVAFVLFCLQVPGLQAYLFRREFGDLVRNHLEGPTGFYALLGDLVLAKKCEIVGKEIRFANGSKIYLCHCQHEKDVYGYHGAEIHLLGIEEATQFTEFMMRYLRTRMRAPKEFLETLPEPLKGRFPRSLLTSNPGGIGHAYLKRAFVDAHPPMTLFQAPVKDGGLLRQYIPARLTDNPSIDAEEYANQLRGVGSESYVRALLDGDWSATVGAFYPEFDYERHVLPAFIPPAHWFRFRSFDWGSSAPFAVFWWAVSDGQEVPALGRALPRGALVAYREWYGCNEESPATGLGMRNEDIAAGILERSLRPEEQRLQTVTDSLPFQDRGGYTVNAVFLKCGVPLIQGDTSRIPGHSQLRSRLRGTPDGGPMIYFVDQCIHAIRTIPLMQHDPNDPEEHIGDEDHAVDAIRLACMSRARIKDEELPEPKTENLSNAITFDQAIERLSRFKRQDNAGW